MLSTLGLSYLYNCSNYSITNIVNVYNSFINILELVDEENKKKIIRIIKNNIGMTFYNDLRDYVNHKYSPNDELFVLFNQ